MSLQLLPSVLIFLIRKIASIVSAIFDILHFVVSFELSLRLR